MAYPSVGSTAWNELAAAYMYGFLEREPRDQYFKKHPTLAWIRGKQSTKGKGDRWAWPIFDGSAPTGRSYVGLQGHTLQDTKVATMAEDEPRFYAEQVAIAHTDEVRTGGEGKLFDLMEQKLRHAKARVTQAHSTFLWAGSKTRTTDPESIPLAIPVDPTASVAFNGLNGASGSQTFWRNKTATCTGSWSADGINKLDSVLNQIAQEAGDPEILVTTKEIFNFIQRQARGHMNLETALQTKAGKQMADLGIPILSHNGIPIIHDSDCTSGNIFALNSSCIEWTAVEGGDYTMMSDTFESTMVTGVMASVNFIRLEGNLRVLERRGLGRVDSITAA